MCQTEKSAVKETAEETVKVKSTWWNNFSAGKCIKTYKYESVCHIKYSWLVHSCMNRDCTYVILCNILGSEGQK